MMTTRRKRIGRTLVLVLALLLAAPVNTAINTMAQSNEAGTNVVFLPLVENTQTTPESSTITIEGTVSQVSSEHPAGQPIISQATLAVEKVLAGKFEGKQLTLRYLGGTVGNVKLRVSHQPILAIGMHLRAKLYQQANAEYSMADAEQDLTILNAEVFAAFTLTGEKWNDNKIPVTFKINPNNSDIAGVAEGDAVRRALNSWNHVTDTYFEFKDGGNTNCKLDILSAPNTDGVNCIAWTTDAAKGGVLASAWQWSDGATDELKEVDIVYYGQNNFGPITWSTTPNSTQFDVETVALHELGHALGLDHEKCCNAIMNPSVDPGEIKRVLTADDINGNKTIYKPTTAETYVDLNAGNQWPCTLAQKCSTVLRGVKHVADGGTVHIRSGIYTEMLTISRSMTLVSENGTATIGQ